MATGIPEFFIKKYDTAMRDPALRKRVGERGRNAESTRSGGDMPWSAAVTVPETPSRLFPLSGPFDLAKTVAPAWWARGRWPNVDTRRGAFVWVGWEAGQVAWRSVRQVDDQRLEIIGSRGGDLDAHWASAVLGASTAMPIFDDPIMAALSRKHAGLRPWSAGSLFEGVVSSIVGQSISVAAAATTERRLYQRFNNGLHLDGREFWPPPRPEQLASSSAAFVRESGVTTKRAEALVAVATLFASKLSAEAFNADPVAAVERLAAISGIGPWTVQSALLWGIAAPDAHPTRDVALLRAARVHYPEVNDLKDLDRVAERWRPYRAWAARLLWLDLLGFEGSEVTNSA
jgi:3-methyladenine DNA glycosylase/8-oxoguanine DNA glycosylase